MMGGDPVGEGVIVQHSSGANPLALAEPAPGVLYLVGTPIGNLADLSPRARAVLAAVDHLACEDTRRSGLLLRALGLKRSLISFHQHNEVSRLPQLLDHLAAGESVAVISDAGLPGLSDPGEALVAAARERGRPVICIPGPSAITTALVSSGLPCDRFCFEGFLPARSARRRQRLEALAAEERTLVLFEAPHRLLDLLEDLLEVLGDRPLRVARELTKCHEEQVGPSVSAALAHFRSQRPLGECTLVLGGAPAAPPAAWDERDLREALAALLAEGRSAKEAAQLLAERTGHRRRDLYALLHRLDMSESGGSPPS
ncbi:MAG: Ribosomal small subunit methyltransferase [Cyanobacteriota bacterium]